MSRRRVRAEMDTATELSKLERTADGLRKGEISFDNARIKTVLSHEMDRLWRAEDPRNRCTPGQRMADALQALLTGPAKRNDDGRSQGTRLLLIAEYDVITGELGKARLPDGTPIPAQVVR